MSVKEFITEFEDGKILNVPVVSIKIKGQFGNNFFLNWTGRLKVLYIDFSKKEITGCVASNDFEDVLRPESNERIKHIINNLQQHE